MSTHSQRAVSLEIQRMHGAAMLRSVPGSRPLRLSPRERSSLEGYRFGRWTVHSRAPAVRYPCGQRRGRWLCRCACGTWRALDRGSLHSGRSQSCGCLMRERNSQLGHARARVRGEAFIGRYFGRLRITGHGGSSRADGRLLLACECACGWRGKVRRASLERGETQSCGCWHAELSRARALDLTGQRYGRLTALRRIGYRGGRALWECRCACGSLHEVTIAHLRSGRSRSCGCLAAEVRRRPRERDARGGRYRARGARLRA